MTEYPYHPLFSSRSNNVVFSDSLLGVSLRPSAKSPSLFALCPNFRKVRLALLILFQQRFVIVHLQNQELHVLDAEIGFKTHKFVLCEWVTHLGYVRSVLFNPLLKFHKIRRRRERGRGRQTRYSLFFPYCLYFLYYSLSRRCPAVVPKLSPILSRFCPTFFVCRIVIVVIT
mgnify:CR=1 FL=1